MNDGEMLQALAQLKTDLIGHIDRQKTDMLDHIDRSDAKLKAELLDHIDRSDAKLKAELLDHIAKLRTDLLDQIHGVGAQLHTQIEDLEKRMDGRFVEDEGRLKLHGGLIHSGSRAIARIIEWTESTDTNLIEHLRRLSEAEKRLADLERKSA
jgi:hypothetical protein